MIMFIASMLVAASVAGVLFTGVDRISGSISDRTLDTSGEIRTDVTIISDPGSDAVYNSSGNDNVTILASNTGEKNLNAEADQISVLINGTFATNMTVTNIEDPSDPVWWTGDVVKIEIHESLGSGDHRVKLVANGDEEVFRFRTS
jgi:flagellar protein FlaG